MLQHDDEENSEYPATVEYLDFNKAKKNLFISHHSRSTFIHTEPITWMYRSCFAKIILHPFEDAFYFVGYLQN